MIRAHGIFSKTRGVYFLDLGLLENSEGVSLPSKQDTARYPQHEYPNLSKYFSISKFRRIYDPYKQLGYAIIQKNQCCYKTGKFPEYLSTLLVHGIF